ncbi:hypothetical protein PMAYCL1PPCAC_19429, partial [Pristionchus mayeri]
FKSADVPEKEMSANLTCSVTEGWKEDNGGMKLIVNPKPGKFAVEAKCIRVCDESALSPKTGSRNYTLDGKLTCDDVKEMLEFNGKAVYSDLCSKVCSKEGWKKPGESTVEAKYDGTPIKADCIPNPCTKDGIEKCTPPPNGECAEPDITTVKYQMSCKSPMMLKYDIDPIKYDKLICKDGKWEQFNRAIAVPTGVQLKVKCVAGKCAKCRDTEAAKKMPCDKNCVANDGEFRQGSEVDCSRYECVFGAYKYKDTTDVTSYFAAKHINADENCNYNTEDGR